MSAEIESGYLSSDDDAHGHLQNQNQEFIEGNGIETNDFAFLSKDEYIEGLKAVPNQSLTFSELVSAIISIYGTNGLNQTRYSYIIDKKSEKYMSEYELDTIMEMLLSKEGLTLGYRIAMEPEFSSKLSFYYKVSSGEPFITLKESDCGCEC